MSKVLVIRKKDATVRVVPLENKARLLAYNNRLPAADKWTFEEMEEAQASKLEFIDKNYVTPNQALNQNKELAASLSEKEAKIAELEAMLAAKTAPTATEVIEKINLSETENDVNTLITDETRKTVLDAAAKKIASFQK